MSKFKYIGICEERQIDNPVEGQWRPCIVKVYNEGIELELWKLTTHKNSLVIHKQTKSFDFADMLLMNETLNKIVGRRQ
jgi:hypothetical protein